MRHAGSIPHLMPRPVIQAAEGVVFASYAWQELPGSYWRACSARAPSRGTFKSKDLVWRRCATLDTTARRCAPLVHYQSKLIATVCTLRCRLGAGLVVARVRAYTQATPDIERRANDALRGRETSSPCAAP